MKKNYHEKHHVHFKHSIITLTTAVFMPAHSIAQTAITFPYTGAVQTFTIHSCLTNMTINARGAYGAAGISAAGLRGISEDIMTVTRGQVPDIYAPMQTWTVKVVKQ